MLELIIIVTAISCIVKLLYISIQTGHFIDDVFDYQRILRNLDLKGSKWFKPLGGCEICFSHFVAVIGYFISVIFMVALKIELINIIFSYLFIVPTSTVLGLILIKKI